jgi:tetratricopeptide (TPR) repeat protein
LALYLFYRVRLSAVRRQQKKLQALVDERTRELSQINTRLSDEINERSRVEESYPKEKIEEINEILYQVDLQQSAFNMAVQNAEFFLNKNDLESALKEFERARELYPDNEQVNATIEEIRTILITNNEYDALIKEADELYIIRDYETAIEKYREAHDLDPDKTYPADMIAKIEETLLNKATTDQQDYDLAINMGNEYLEEQNYKLAKSQFEFALRIKPDETLPKKSIAVIDSLIVQYDVLITKGDHYLEQKEYQHAMTSYEDAAMIMPEENYPVEKIAEIEVVLLRLAEEESLMQDYQNYITEADSLYENENYEEALTMYSEASALLPTEDHPKNRIAEIETLLFEIAEMKAVETRYNNLIAEGDRLFEVEDYAGAKRKYQEAHLLILDETYAYERIEEIDRIVADMAAFREKTGKIPEHC